LAVLLVSVIVVVIVIGISQATSGEQRATSKTLKTATARFLFFSSLLAAALKNPITTTITITLTRSSACL